MTPGEPSLAPTGRTMTDSSTSQLAEIQLEEFRGYLLVLARLRLEGWLRRKLTASDIVQQTLLRAHAALPALRDRSPEVLKAWLREILGREIADAAKHFGRAKRDAAKERALCQALDRSSLALEMLLAADQTSPSQAAIRHEDLLALADALCRLPDDQRVAVTAKHIENRSLREIAESMGRSPASVAGLLRRGLAQLRAALDSP